MNDPVINAMNLTVERGDKTVLNKINITLESGEICALLGGNGAGKSTTLLTVMGFLSPLSGQVSVLGKNVHRNPFSIRKNIAYLPENSALYPHLNAYENIRYFLTLSAMQRSTAEIDKALDTVSLQVQSRTQYLESYSKGMRQKVALALALLRQTPVLLLDEPTSGLDPLAVEDFHTIINSLAGKGISILMVTHDLYGACQVAHTVSLLQEGCIVGSFYSPGKEGIEIDQVKNIFLNGEAA